MSLLYRFISVVVFFIRKVKLTDLRVI